jgi:two-component system, LytTR family, sensor kinase
MFAHKYRYLFIVMLAGYSVINTWSVELFEHYPLPVSYTHLFFIFLALVLFIWESNRHINRILDTTYPSVLKKISYSFGASIFSTAIASALIASVYLYFYSNILPENRFLAFKLLLIFSFRVNLFLNVLHIIFWYIAELESAKTEKEKLKKVNTQAQLQALKNQINPHFLFNNLSVLSALVQVNPDKSIFFIKQFSKVYRYVLQQQEKELVDLQAELSFLEPYIFLLKTRFGESLEIKLDLKEKDYTQWQIVPLALQMLLENAVKHNIISKNKPLEIIIKHLDSNYLEISNNIQKKSVPEESNFIGLANISQRYGFLSNKEVKSEIAEGRFLVRVPLLPLAVSESYTPILHFS